SRIVLRIVMESRADMYVKRASPLWSVRRMGFRCHRQAHFGSVGKALVALGNAEKTRARLVVRDVVGQRATFLGTHSPAPDLCASRCACHHRAPLMILR